METQFRWKNPSPASMRAEEVMGLAKCDHVRSRREMNRVRRVPPPPEPTDGDSLAKRLVYQRLALGLTQAEVAKKVTLVPKSGIHKNSKRVLSRNAYCTYELGQVEPSLSTIVEIAHVLRASPGWLAFGTGKKPSNGQEGSQLFLLAGL